MKKNLTLLCLGVALGIVFQRMRHLTADPRTAITEVVTITNPHTSVGSFKTMQDLPANVVIEKIPEETGMTSPTHSKNVEPMQPAAEVIRVRRHFSLTEAGIQELETREDEMKNKIYTETNDRGWVVHVLQNENIFSQNGIEDGDVIPFESLEPGAFGPANPALASRMSQFLNRIRH